MIKQNIPRPKDNLGKVVPIEKILPKIENVKFKPLLLYQTGD